MRKAITEQYEWCNFWWDDTQNSNKRVLLIGDSITNGYRPFVKELADYNVDMLATSKAVDNPNFIKELEYAILSHGFSYEKIHFNNGIHGPHMDINNFALHLEKVILHIKSISDAELIITLCTPITSLNELGVLSEEKNPMIIERNKVISELAKKHSLWLDNLYTPMLNCPEYCSGDGYHYNDDGRRFQSELVIKTL